MSSTAAIKGKGVALSDDKKKSVTVVSNSKVEGKSSSSTKTVTKTSTVRTKTEKKVYTLPGQKRDPPEEREPSRIFYESLYKQIPTSEMAEFWMMEHGLLPPDKAKKAYEKKQKRPHQLKTGTPTKSVKQERPESSKKPQPSKGSDSKAKKRVEYSDNDDDDDDFIAKFKKVRG